ncbi:MAG TPA: hypothetical protein DD671_03605 [Balneolaceae bacterium]|nr:hypothetical protein [Balneolaceae bacterium]
MRPLTKNNLKHFYFNKYFVTPFKQKRYPISYCYHYKAIWFRTYKVASRTIHHLLKENSPEKSYIYSSPVSYQPDRYKDFFKFTFVRNPLDRFFSIWKGMVLKRNYFEFPESEYQKMKDFQNFLDWVESKNFTNADIHLVPQHKLIDTDHVDFVGRFENFEEDLLKVADEINLPVEKSNLVHRNKSPRKELSIEEKDRERILRLYQKDVELFYPHLEF